LLVGTFSLLPWGEDSDEFCDFSPAAIGSIDDEWMGGGVGLTDGGMML